MTFETVLKNAPVVLTEGSLIERLRRDPAVELDPYVLHAGFIYEAVGRQRLETLFRQYLDTGRKHGVPMIICTPTWKAGKFHSEQAGFSHEKDINGDSVRFLDGIRRTYGPYAERIFIGGLMGSRGDAYQPAEALPENEAADYHRHQIQALKAGGADFIIAETFPALSEAEGAARAAAASGIPYIIGFVIRPAGTLLDGTPLHQAVSEIDGRVSPAPLCYVVNCVHPTVFESALIHEQKAMPDITRRVAGLMANTSAKSPEELENAEILHTEEPEAFASAMQRVRERFGTRVLGGCCGTDHRHIEALAEAVCGPSEETA